MADQPTNLDTHRGMAAQKATDLRRLRSEVEADEDALHTRQTELEDLLAAAPPPTGRRRSRRHAICLASWRRAWMQAICAAAG
jgi:hypothetical protein